MKYMIYSSKYEAIVNAVGVPGRLGMEECSDLLSRFDGFT